MSTETLDPRQERQANRYFLFQLLLLAGLVFTLSVVIGLTVFPSRIAVEAAVSEQSSIIGARVNVVEVRKMIANLPAIDWDRIVALHDQFPFPLPDMSVVQGEFEVLSWMDAIHWGFDQVGIEFKGNVGKSLVLVDQIPSLFAVTDVVARACEEQVEMEEKMARFRGEALAIMVHEYAHLYLSHCDTPPFPLASFEEDDVLEWMAQQKESQAQALTLVVLIVLRDTHSDEEIREIASEAVKYQDRLIAAHAMDFFRQVSEGVNPYADVTEGLVYGLIPELADQRYAIWGVPFSVIGLRK